MVMLNRWLKNLMAMALLVLLMTGCASDGLEKMIPADATGVVSLDVPHILKEAGMLDDGKIVEQGSHRTLVKRGGAYSQLWSRQSGAFLDEQ
jgi:PBP1b-binding outer membrane lipoprotein LpoB